MRKKLFVATIAAIAVGGAVWNLHQKSCQETSLSDLTLNNIEALAEEQIGNGPYYVCWQTVSATVGAMLLHEKNYCGNCATVPATYWTNENACRK